MLLIQMIVGLGVIAFGGVLLASGLRARPRGWMQVGAGAVVLGLAACLAASALWHSFAIGSVDWNPENVRLPDLVGTWEAGASRLTLDADGTFHLVGEGEAVERIGSRCRSGTWSFYDWNLTLEPPGALDPLEAPGPPGDTVRPCRLRIVGVGGGYRIYEQPGDLDGWGPWAGFQRVSPRP
jgi:hypothetical protein